jgi:predicted SprT family Zn-dependent metalloprotease
MHPKQLEEVARTHARQLAEWGELWNTPGLESRLKISWSGRMFRSLGRCTPTKGIIRLSVHLAEADPLLLEEVICHEAAHAAVHELHRARLKPHGREWAGLMRTAGFKPRASIRVELPGAVLAARAVTRKRFLHRCPVCGASRVSPSSRPRWRCGACRKAGLGGWLEILPLPPEDGSVTRIP